MTDQINLLNEVISDLKKSKTESALSWVNSNFKAINLINGGANFIFKLHQANLRKLLHKSVDIHFEINYKHLCDTESNILFVPTDDQNQGSSLVE